jgi:dTMP kinase
MSNNWSFETLQIHAGQTPDQVKTAIEAALDHYLSNEHVCIPG